MLNKPFFETEMSVRIHDINHGNHLDFARLIALIGNARACMFKAYQLDDLNSQDVGIIMRALQIKYKGQAFFEDQLLFSLYVQEFTERGVTILTKVFNQTSQKPVADCEYKLSFFDYTLQKPVRASEYHKKIFHKQDH
jgi:acyl-CoA thioesterase FadM